jgi:hypothetical protein
MSEYSVFTLSLQRDLRLLKAFCAFSKLQIYSFLSDSALRLGRGVEGEICRRRATWELRCVCVVAEQLVIGLVQHGFAKIGAIVLYLSVGILMNICAKLNICTSISPTSASPKPLAVIDLYDTFIRFYCGT